MTVFVTELRGYGFNFPVPTLLGSNSLQLSVGSSVSTGALVQPLTNMMLVTADTGAYLLQTSSNSTAIVTSTNGVRIPANTPPMLFAASPFARLTCLST